MGEGALGACGPRLQAMGAHVVNRWISESEISEQFSRYHAVVLSHIEASQSGVAATALGAGLPLIATPVGGLVEQIEVGQTGLIAERVDAQALADAVERLMLNEGLYTHMVTCIAESSGARSVETFVEKCVATALLASSDRRGGRRDGSKRGYALTVVVAPSTYAQGNFSVNLRSWP